ncbi:MAG: 4-amino-4-deoxy-L-arabinose transferase-like glycosyltransferase [Roseivirga sp.]|jgi:4-amino-4-deoxy-L-arabinose transferase-like glycosyltransferase
MNKLAKFLTLEASHKQQVRFLMLVISVMYFYNFSVNDIWTPNESFYAESVREMFESGNFLDIQYNYEPRYNKPPLTYWLIAASSSVFGLNEFGIRLPMILLTLGSVWLTYLLGKKFFGEKGGIYSMLMMAVSVQLMAVKQYASPEVPLTFFFTLTLYYFIRAYTENKSLYYHLSYIALGLTVLTKGYPYIVIIGGIIGLFVLIDSRFSPKVILQKVSKMKLLTGIPIVLIIGMSWVIYMYISFGNDFWEIFQRETFDRAFTRNEKSMRPFFYLEVMSWTILPYSLAFFMAVGYYIFNFKRAKKEVIFALSWLMVMFVIFTAAKGKIPTYFIQAHPAMVLIITSLLVSQNSFNKLFSKIWSISFLFPAGLISIASFTLVYYLELNVLMYSIPILLFAVLTICIKRSNSFNSLLIAIPFWAALFIYFQVGYHLSSLEDFRPYDIIGSTINSHTEIEIETPILIEATLIHNIPFYAKRKALRDKTVSEIQNFDGSTLALVRSDSFTQLYGFETLWSGWIYDFPSESQFAKFIIACLEAEKGDMAKFEKYYLVFRNDSDHHKEMSNLHLEQYLN